VVSEASSNISSKDHRELDIVQSEKGAGFKGLKGCITAIKNGEVIKALILKQNSVIGFISGKHEFSQFGG
jgi:hypothetical protein